MDSETINRNWIYLAGPMTGWPNFNYDEFNKWAKIIRNAGRTVINPAEGFCGNQTLPRETYLRKAAKQVSECHEMYLLTGWERSKGVVEMELPIAIACGLDIFVQAGNSFVKKEFKSVPVKPKEYS